jgi:uncharacterized protein
MPYLIDGHNLIPKVGLRLDSPDDEMELVAILQEFARLKRQQVEVYFDGAPIGYDGARSVGTVRVHFVRLGQTADDAIRSRLNRMAKNTKNWIVVSSDREIQSAAHVAQAQFVSSEKFAKIIKTAVRSAPKTSTDNKKLSSVEVDEWLKIFQNKGDKL